jgi:heparosan-N-sulfate-glucuronate 5-epimerase
VRARRQRITPGFFSSSRVHSQPVGTNVRPGELGGYYIDFSHKLSVPRWPPEWLDAPKMDPIIGTAQWGLGAYERHLAGEGEAWRDAAVKAALHLLDEQEQVGAHAGAWVHRYPLPHTYDVGDEWISAMAQGQGASLLVRMYVETGRSEFAAAARLALEPLAVPVSSGGVRADLGSGFFLQEYPTDPPSHVLNGGIFALWGYYDVGLGLGDADARRAFDDGLATLVQNVGRWDTGAWTRYDLFPFPVKNVASSFYHLLHIEQLRALQLIAPEPELASAIDQFQRYRASRVLRMRAFAAKALFRVVVPRNRLLARRTPFRRPRTTR